MKLREMTPWNWFHREGQEGAKPVSREGQYPAHPFQQMVRLQQEMDRAFEDMFSRFGMPSLPESGRLGQAGVFLQPTVDIKESDERYEIDVEIPGVEEKDLKLEVTGDTLTLSGEKRREFEEEKDNYHRTERSYGTFRRVLNLPENVNKDGIEANFKNGVLKVTLPKVEPSPTERRQIEIKPKG